MTKSQHLILFTLAVGFVILFFAAMIHEVNISDSGRPPHHVAYAVHGRGPASVTIRNGTGGTEQQDVLLPWTKVFVPEPGQLLYVSAQLRDDATSGIDANILVDGQTIRHAESNAQYGIATVSVIDPN